MQGRTLTAEELELLLLTKQVERKQAKGRNSSSCLQKWRLATSRNFPLELQDLRKERHETQKPTVNCLHNLTVLEFGEKCPEYTQVSR